MQNKSEILTNVLFGNGSLKQIIYC